MEIESDHLEVLIGRHVRYRGCLLSIVDVLPDRPAIVLEEMDGTRRLQPNQFGEAARWAPTTWTIPLTGPDGAPHPLIAELTPA